MTAPLRVLDDGACSLELREALARAPTAPALSPELDAKFSGLAAQLVAGGFATAVLGTATAKAATVGTATAKAATVGTATAKAATVGTASAVTEGSVLSKVLSSLVFAKLATKIAVGTVLVTAFGSAGYLVAGPLMAVSRKEPQRVLSAPSPVVKQPLMMSSSNVVLPVPNVVVSTLPNAVSSLPVARTSSKDRELLTSKDDSSVEQSVLAREERLLEVARATLGSDPAQSLEITREHAKLFPLGQLSDERELIAVDALLRLGRRNEAWRRAAPRLAQAPESLYAKRLRQLFGGDAPEE